MKVIETRPREIGFVLWGHCQYLLDDPRILRKTIEGYFDSVPSLTFNTIKTKLIMHAFHSSRYLQVK